MVEPAHRLSLRNISKRYGALAAVDDVSLTVGNGEFLTLLGPSGSGKTTLLMMVAGFTEPSAGAIEIDGRDITRLPPEKRNFGMVFQGYALFPHLTVAQNVAFPLTVRRRPRTEIAERVASALDLVQLRPLAERAPRQLSGGQQQRVALARALVFSPDLLLLDEPLSALDKKLRAELQWELKSLHQRLGKTFIYVTHDQEEALSLSDRIAILRDGRVIQLGRPAELYERPATTFVADFLGKSNFIDAVVDGTHADHFTYRIGEAQFAQLRDGAAPTVGERITLALRPEKMSLTIEPAADGNSLAGEIVASSYLGTSLHFCVRTNAVGEMLVTVPAWRLAIAPDNGRQVWINWDRDASVVVRPDRDRNPHG
jgi:putative spermidine/putrescine transport system ATP-binding protein